MNDRSRALGRIEAAIARADLVMERLQTLHVLMPSRVDKLYLETLQALQDTRRRLHRHLLDMQRLTGRPPP